MEFYTVQQHISNIGKELQKQFGNLEEIHPTLYLDYDQLFYESGYVH